MADPELAYPGDPFGLGVRSTMQSSSVYITDADTLLRVRVLSPFAGLTVGVNGLRVDDKGVAQPIAETVTQQTNYLPSLKDFPIGKGTLLRLTLFVAPGVIPIYGQVYVIAQLIRGLSVQQVLATLCGGYITQQQAIGFPGSPVRSSADGGGWFKSVLGTQPAAGLEISEAIPANVHWDLLYAVVKITASAVAGNRVVRIIRQSGVNNASIGQFPTVFGAGAIIQATFARYQPIVASVALASGVTVRMDPLVVGATLVGSDTWRTLTDGIDAGDQWAAPLYNVLETMVMP